MTRPAVAAASPREQAGVFGDMETVMAEPSGAQNAAIALRFQSEHHGRGVCDPRRLTSLIWNPLLL